MGRAVMSEQNKFTSGPWWIEDQIWVRAMPDGRVYEEDLGRIVAQIIEGPSDPVKETNGNARLISRSPNMFDLLIQCLEYFEDREDVSDGPDGQPVANEAMRLASEIRAEIAKAGGT